MRLLKINLYFEQSWWLDGTIDPPVQFGPNFSNLPINAIYPFYALPPDPESSNAIGVSKDEDAHAGASALTIYCDFDNTAFWQGVQNLGAKFASPLQEVQSIPPRVLFPASNQVVYEAKKQLCELFGIAEVPDPVFTSYRLWDGSDDFEFAYHQWRLGVDDVAIRQHLANPFPDVYVCNEAYSDMHGWVNGSLRSCELAIAAIGLGPFTQPACQSAAPPPSAVPLAHRSNREGITDCGEPEPCSRRQSLTRIGTSRRSPLRRGCRPRER